MTNPVKMLVDMIASKAESDRKNNVWVKGAFMQIRALTPDTRGELGEEFVERLLVSLGYTVERSNVTDRTKKHWDLRVNGVALEIKTATVGKSGRSFQHENIEKDRDYDGIVLLDIAPDAIYLTAASKKDLPFNSPNDLWTKSPKQMHRRAHGIQYKWDLSIKDVADREIKSLTDVERLMADLLPPVSEPNTAE